MVVYYDEEDFSIRIYHDCVKGELVGLIEVIPIDELLEVWQKHKADTNDIVEVVRCKNCVYWKKITPTLIDEEAVYDCPLFNEWGDENGFCSFGERRD